jgi:Tfp pilus assembly protein PilV
MGLAGVQARMLVESRTANHRAVAIGFIDDLSNRMLLNRDAAMANNYALAWGASQAAVNCAAPAGPSCTGAQLAQSDLNLWRAALVAALPGGNARVFQSPSDARQIGIAVAWSANERRTDKMPITKLTINPFATNNANSGTNCPANSICHVVYVQP